MYQTKQHLTGASDIYFVRKNKWVKMIHLTAEHLSDA